MLFPIPGRGPPSIMRQILRSSFTAKGALASRCQAQTIRGFSTAESHRRLRERMPVSALTGFRRLDAVGSQDAHLMQNALVDSLPVNKAGVRMGECWPFLAMGLIDPAMRSFQIRTLPDFLCH